jgi:hypothetical protein
MGMNIGSLLTLALSAGESSAQVDEVYMKICSITFC